MNKNEVGDCVKRGLIEKRGRKKKHRNGAENNTYSRFYFFFNSKNYPRPNPLTQPSLPPSRVTYTSDTSPIPRFYLLYRLTGVRLYRMHFLGFLPLLNVAQWRLGVARNLRQWRGDFPLGVEYNRHTREGVREGVLRLSVTEREGVLRLRVTEREGVLDRYNLDAR